MGAGEGTKERIYACKQRGNTGTPRKGETYECKRMEVEVEWCGKVEKSSECSYFHLWPNP